MLKKWLRTWPGAELWLPVLVGTVCGSVLCCILLYGCAFIISGMQQLPEQALPILTTVLLGISGWTSGFFSGKCAGEKGIWYGLAGGAVLSLLVLFISLYGYHTAWNASLTTRLSVLVLSAALGGILSVNMGGAPHYHGRK